MTHGLHREGTIDSLEGDYALYVYPARGINIPDSSLKVLHLLKLLYLTGPANISTTPFRRNLYSGVSQKEVLDNIIDGSQVHCLFKSKEKLKQALARIKEADEGMSIVVVGLIDQVRQIAAELGLNPHTINLSLGIHGTTRRLPPPEIRQFTTMCGHAMVSMGLVYDVIRKVKKSKVTAWEGSLILTAPCTCGIYNPYRSEKLLLEMAPLYTVNRW